MRSSIKMISGWYLQRKSNNTYIWDPQGEPLFPLTYNYNNYSDTSTFLASYLPYYKNSFKVNAETLHNSFYKNGEHITSFVNSFYIIGRNVETVNRVIVDDYPITTWTNNANLDGDGTVEVISASLSDRYSQRTFYKNGVSHVNLIKDTEIIEFIIQLISGNTSVYDYDGISED